MHKTAVHHIQEPTPPVDSPAGTSIDIQRNLDEASQLRLKILAEVLSLKVACCWKGLKLFRHKGADDYKQATQEADCAAGGVGSDADSQRVQLEEAACLRLNRLGEVLSVGVACSMKGPPAEHIIRLLVTMYRLLKSVTLLTKAPQSESHCQTT